MRQVGLVRLVRLVAVAVPALAAATALVWLLEDQLGVPNASPVYLVAVVAAALASGTLGAVLCAVSGIAIYDFFFTQPFHTFTISDPGEWLSLALLLFVGLVVGQLAALQRAQTLTASTREREARELFGVGRALATRSSTRDALPEIAELLRTATGMRSVRVALGDDDAAERDVAVAGSPKGEGVTIGALHHVLRRMPGDEPARWVRLHAPGAAAPAAGRVAPVWRVAEVYRVRIEAGGGALGSIWSVRDRSANDPDRSATRLLAAAADQIGQLLVQDRLAAEAREAEVARRSDTLKSALLQSVSHDLRTPLAAIRAAAGTLRPGSGLDEAARAASAAAIEREVQQLDRLVANLLDLGRIQAGALTADLDVFELDDLVGRATARLATVDRLRSIDVEVPPLIVRADPILLDTVLANLLDNAMKFAPPEAPIAISAVAIDGHAVRLVVEDGGPGVPDEMLDRIFEPFVRGRQAGRGRAAARGTGLGLAVVRGLVEVMGGVARAHRSRLGGLAVEIDLPTATVPAELSMVPS